MVMARRACPVLLTLVLGCGVQLVTPDSLRVRCADDDECPTGRCSATVGICIAKDDDDSPLRIASALALDSRHIAVLFNRPVDPATASDFTVYALSPGLSPESAVVADDHLSVTVQTTEQKLRTYLLDVVDVADPIGRPLERTQKEFTGIGDQVSGSSPTPLAPLDHTLFADPSITLTWASLPDALNYAVEVLRVDAAGATPIDGSPFMTRDTELTVLVGEDATYTWTVSADTSREPPVASSFVVFGDALHVYCAAADDCSAPDSWDAGTSARPSRRIGRALALAAFLSRGEVRVAGRGAGAVYEEAFVVAPPVTRLAGGYDAAFTRVDPPTPTVIRGDPNAVRVITTQPVVLSDLEIQSSGGSALVMSGVGDVTATRLTLSSNADGRPLDVRRCAEDALLRLSFVTTGILPGGELSPERSRISGGCGVIFDHAAIGGAGIAIVKSSASFVDSSVVATVGFRSTSQDFVGTETYALLVDAASVALERTYVRAGVDDENGTRVGIRVLPSSSLDVTASTIVATRSPFGDCFPDDCQGEANAIEAGEPGATSAVRVLVTNSVLAASAAPFVAESVATGVRWHGPGQLALLNDVLYVADGTGLRGDVGNALADDRQVLNSAIVCAGDGVGVEDGSDVLPHLLRSTAFVGCNTIYRYLGTSYTTAESLKDLASSQPHVFTNLHVFDAPIAATFPGYTAASPTPDDDWSCGPACAGIGESSRDPICGADAASPCAIWVSVDSTGAPRTVPVSIGPREVD